MEQLFKIEKQPSNLKLFECRKIFLDTSFIIDIMRPETADERSSFAKKLLEAISKLAIHNKYRPEYYISSISVGEIMGELSKELAFNVVKALKTSDVIFLEYDNQIAEYQKSLFNKIQTTKELNKLAKQLNILPGNLVNAREYINRDFMIIATAKYSNVDVTFTSDKKTFKPIADKIDLFCIPTYKEYFATANNGSIIEFK